MRGRFSTFLREEGGTVVVLFGVLLVPLFGFLGGAVDYGKSLQVRTHLQEAADAAALAAASLEPNARESERRLFT